MKKLLLLMICNLLLQSTFAQERNETEKWVEKTINDLLENQNIGSDLSDLELELKEWIKNPQNLNYVGMEQLSRLPFLNQKQLTDILEHRKKHGAFLSIYELQAITSLDVEEAKLLAKFVYVEERKQSDYLNPTQYFGMGQHEILLQEARSSLLSGEEAKHAPYVGSLDHLSIRYRFAYKTKLYMGFGLEKDPGERWGKVGDFQTFHLFYKGSGLLKTIALGDFHVNFGSGLNVGTSMFNGKSALVFQTSYLQEGFKPSRSLNEVGFMRGIGIGLQKRNVSLSFWLSASPLSAKLSLDNLGDFSQISSIVLSGLHRTEAELLKRRTIYQENIGIHLSYTRKYYSLGCLYQKQEQVAQSHFGSNQNIKQVMNLGNNMHVGAYGSLLIKNIQTHVEISTQNNDAFAIQIKSIVPLHAKLDGLILYRNYTLNFENQFGNGWAASSSMGNEEGMYVAFLYKPKKSLLWSVYADVFGSKAASYQKIKAAKSSDYLILFNWLPSKTFSLESRIRVQETERNYADVNLPVTTLKPEHKKQFRIHVNYQIGLHWQYQFRMEWNNFERVNQLKSNGNLIYHDFAYKGSKNWHLRARICYFDVSDYTARIYMQESDLPYSFASQMMMNKGNYYYVLSSFKISKSADLHFKISYLSRNNNQDNSKLELYKEMEFKCQLRIKIRGE
ncbi:MAG: helix-hairpin-helix domain-containing protein [bacterium]|nr:helix-hairpin-helix domain-containing protein [bacterium]